MKLSESILGVGFMLVSCGGNPNPPPASANSQTSQPTMSGMDHDQAMPMASAAPPEALVGSSAGSSTADTAPAAGSSEKHIPDVTSNNPGTTAASGAKGNLTVTINSEPVISQPGPFAQGQTVVTEKAQIDLKQEGKGFMVLPAGAKLADVVKALNTLGATPADLLAILQAMKSAGALKAELEII